MSNTITNRIPRMYDLRGQSVDRMGKDTTGKIQYQFNNQGFRSDRDFDFVPDWCFFGCSHVFGIGVPYEQIFASKFSNSHNYGVCGDYDNKHIQETIQQFVNSELFSPHTKMVVFWTDRDSDLLESYCENLWHLNMKFFFCSPPLPHKNCHKMIPNLDLDVSGTHMGPKTHEFLYRTICRI